MELELRINGVVVDQEIVPNQSVCSLLRREGYASVKQGCETGECGACTVLVDNVPRPSCVMLAAQAGGCALTTVEGLGALGKLHPLQTAFIECGAAPCGFCTPGMLLSAHALLQRTPAPTQEEVRDALSGNLCRCSGYAKPVQAVLRAAAVMRGEEPSPLAQAVEESAERWDEERGEFAEKMQAAWASGAENGARVTTKIPVITPETREMHAVGNGAISSKVMPLRSVVGKSLAAVNATRLVTGKPAFMADIAPAAMLHGRILGSPHAHAIIRSISTARAKSLPGVYEVVTYKDVARVPFARSEQSWEGETLEDQYCLDERVRYVGDRVAAVVAETAEIAEEALRLIEVDYEVLPSVLDARLASDPRSAKIHPEVEARGISDARRNIAARIYTSTGDVEQAFTDADQVVESEYILPATQAAALANHSAISYFDEDGFLVVRTDCQAPHYLRSVLARLLEIPLRRIRIVQTFVGESLAERREIVLEDICALMTLRTQRPVQFAYSREEEFKSGQIRAPHIIRLKTGVKKDGTIIAQQMVVLADSGAYGTHAVIAARHATNALQLYPCDHVRIITEVVYTNHQPASSVLADEQAAEFFALECHMDEVAQSVGMDGLSLRRRNGPKVGERLSFTAEGGRNVPAVRELQIVALERCVHMVEEKINWSEKHGKKQTERFRKGVGIALAFQHARGVDVGTSGAMIKVNEDGSCDVFTSCTENEGDSYTRLTQIAAEAIGLPFEDVLLHAGHTDIAPFALDSAAANAFYGSANAVKKAAEQVNRQLLAVAGRMLKVLPETLKLRQGAIKTASGQRITVAQVAAHALFVEHRQIMTTASWKEQAASLAFMAQGVEVEVDMETGGVRILNVVTALDTGTLINPLLTEVAVEGLVSRALGISMSEELFYNMNGALLTTNLRDYHIPAVQDMPRMETYFVQVDGTSELFGAKPTGFLPFYGVAPALVNAIADATTLRLHQIPLTPERVLRAIHSFMTNTAKR